MLFYVLMALVGLIPLAAKGFFPSQISWEEVVLQGVVAFGIAYGGWSYGVYAKAARTEIWNGEITGKTRDEVPCSHDYKCRCKMVWKGKGEDRHKVEECDTCYEHRYDVNWDVQSNVGNFNVPRVDRQGKRVPARWSKFQPGQPMAKENTYANYVSAQDSSLFHDQLAETKGLPEVPEYPRVYDYQYIDRVLPVGVVLEDRARWNDDLAAFLKALGPQKQANITVILVDTPDPMFRYKVEATWSGVNKNDIVVLLGVLPVDMKILWADVITFAHNTGNEDLQVRLRNRLLEIGVAERTKVLPAIAEHVGTLYTRPHMKDFEYLAYDMEPSTWYQIVFGILFLLANGGLTLLFRATNFTVIGFLQGILNLFLRKPANL